MSAVVEIATQRLAFTVYGMAQPAGSKQAARNSRTGGLFVRDANPKAKDWQVAVAAAAGQAMAGRALMEGPLELEMTFFRPRPASHLNRLGELNALGRRTPWPTSRPDVLKLARACEDAMTGVVWRDDAQVVVQRLAKTWGWPDTDRAQVRTEVLAAGEP